MRHGGLVVVWWWCAAVVGARECFVYVEQEHAAASAVTSALEAEGGACTLDAFEAARCAVREPRWVIVKAKKMTGGGLVASRAAKECQLFTLFREPVAAFLASYHANLWRRSNATYEEWATRPDGRGEPSPVSRQLRALFNESHAAGGGDEEGDARRRRGRELRSSISPSFEEEEEDEEEEEEEEEEEDGDWAERIRRGDLFPFVGLVERPIESADWWDEALPLVASTRSWAAVFEEVQRRVDREKASMTLEEMRMFRLFEPELMAMVAPDAVLYEAATRHLYAHSRRLDFTAECAREPFGGGYLWIHSWGHSAYAGVKAEGFTAWRPVIARAVALAKRLGTGLIAPCVRHSVLVPCRVPPGRLQRPDPTPTTIEDRVYDDDVRKRGFTDEMDEWLHQGLLASLDEDEEEEDDADDDDNDEGRRAVLESEAADDEATTDDATRGLPGDMALLDLGAYFDLQAIADYLGGSLDRVLTVDCAASLVAPHPQHARMSWATKFLSFPVMKKQLKAALQDPVRFSVLRLGGGLDSDSLKEQAGEEAEFVERSVLRFAPHLEARAAAYAVSRLGGASSSSSSAAKYAVIHWRAESLVGRRDEDAPAAFDACAAMVLAQIDAFKAASSVDHVLLVSDIPSDPNRPLWATFATKVRTLAPDTMAPRLEAFVRAARDRGAEKYDADLPADADLGDVAIVETILAENAAAFATHDGSDASTCGAIGRFGKAIVAKRQAQNKPPHASWFSPPAIVGDLAANQPPE